MKNYAKCTTLPLGSIKAEKFLKEQLERSKHGIGGHLPEIEPGMIADPFVREFHVKQWDEEKQAGWGAEISGNYYAGLVQLAYTLDDPELKDMATEWVNAVLNRQQEDGYMGTYLGPDAKIYEDYNAWGTGCGMRALLFYYEATGREDVFDAVYRCMLWFARTWSGDKKTTYAAPLIMEPALYCYKKTGDERLLDFVKDYTEFLCDHTAFKHSYKHFLEPEFKYNSTHTAGYGHLVRYPALLYSVTGEEIYLKATEVGIDKIIKKGTHLSGSPVSVVEYTGPVGCTTETEYCSYAFFDTTYIFMSAITGDSKYADYSEQMVYNGAQGARKKDERAIAYLSAPNQVFATNESSSSGPEPDMQVYAPCYPTSCCPVNAVAVVPEFIRGMAMQDEARDLYISAYGPCRIDYDGWKVHVDTLYPFEETVTLHISGANGRKLYCRIPGWASGYQVQVNGKTVKAAKDACGYICLEDPDLVQLEFDAPIEVVRVDDTDCAAKYPLAFRRGPLLYSLKIEADWQKYYPETETPLTPEWPWYNVLPVKPKLEGNDHYENVGIERDLFPWSVAVDEKLNSEDIRFERSELNGYPWENPNVKLHVPAYRAPLLSASYPRRTFEPFGDKQYVTDALELTLVPYGATNLRITYFPRANV